MRGWIGLCSDVSWADYHGLWAKKAKDGSWYVLKWTNMYDACGENDCKRDGVDQYMCDVLLLALHELTHGQKEKACDSAGLIYLLAEGGYQIEDNGQIIVDKFKERALVECCIAYGFGAPLYTETGHCRPLNVRAKARRFAEECMRDEVKRAQLLNRSVNAVGSTAAEYGRGDVMSAQDRGPFDTASRVCQRNRCSICLSKNFWICLLPM